MDKEGIEELLEVKDWLQEEISEVDEEKLKALLRVIDRALAELPTVEVKPKTGAALAEIKRVFESEVAKFLEFTQRGNVVVIRRIRFLERSVWLAVTEKVRPLNGRWISAGEDSRWEIYLDRIGDASQSTSVNSTD